MKTEIKSLFYGEEIVVGEHTAIVQKCRYCHNDNFVVIVMEHGKYGLALQLICPKCDQPHAGLMFTKVIPYQQKSMFKEVWKKKAGGKG